jgi:hypothetical protein
MYDDDIEDTHWPTPKCPYHNRPMTLNMDDDWFCRECRKEGKLERTF